MCYISNVTQLKYCSPVHAILSFLFNFEKSVIFSYFGLKRVSVPLIASLRSHTYPKFMDPLPPGFGCNYTVT